MTERRAGKFTETLSLFMVKVAAIGAFIVLIDIKFTFTIFEQVVTIGSGFSADLKGAVIASILISGFAAVKEYWLGASASGQTQSESMSRIAEASTGTPLPADLKTDNVKIDAAGADITIDKGPKP